MCVEISSAMNCISTGFYASQQQMTAVMLFQICFFAVEGIALLGLFC